MLQARWLVLFVCMFSQILLSSKDNAIRALSEASGKGDLPEVQRLLQDSRAIDSLNKNPSAVAAILTQACCDRGNLELIKELLQVPIMREHASRCDRYGETPLVAACSAGNLPIVQELLKVPTVRTHADAKSFQDERTALMGACIFNHLPLVQVLLQVPEVVNGIHARDERGCTALIEACMRHNLPLVQMLLQVPEVVNGIHVRDEQGCTALMRACSSGSVEVVRELLQVPTVRDKLDICDNYDQTPLMIACMCGKSDIVTLLLSEAIVLRTINSRDSRGRTALMHADVSIVEDLLQLPEVINGIYIRENHGMTALMDACYYGRIEVVRKLLQVPEVINAIHMQDNDGRTALMLAGVSIVEDLLQVPEVINGIHMQDNDGMTALMVACYYGRIEVVRKLLQVPAIRTHVNFCDDKGVTALMIALRARQMPVFSELLKAPVDITKQDNTKTSCLNVLKKRSSDVSLYPQEKDYIDEVLQVYDIQEPSCSTADVGEMTVLWDAYTKFQKGDKELIREVLFKIPFILKAATKLDFWVDRMQFAVNKMFDNDSDRMRLFMQYIVTDNTQKVLANRYLKACNQHARLIPVPKHNPKLGIFGHDTRKLSERLEESVDVHQDVLSSSVSKMNLEDID